MVSGFRKKQKKNFSQKIMFMVVGIVLLVLLILLGVANVRMQQKRKQLNAQVENFKNKIAEIKQKNSIIGWVEPMRNWILKAQNIDKIVNESNLFTKKVAMREIVGSNLILRNREAFEKTPSGTKLSSQTAWGAVAAVRRFVEKKSKSWIVERDTVIETAP